LDKPILVAHSGRGYPDKPCLVWRDPTRTNQL